MEKVQLSWRSKSIASTVTHVPSVPGLYVIGHTESICGLELARSFVYVGKTLNMRRRLLEHTHLTELHPELAAYLRQRRGKVTIWFTTDVTIQGLDAFERLLIRVLRPVFNRLTYENKRRKTRE